MVFPSLEHPDLDTHANAAFNAGEQKLELELKRPVAVAELITFAGSLNVIETPVMAELRLQLLIGGNETELLQSIKQYGDVAREQALTLDAEFQVEAQIGLLIADAAVFLQASMIDDALESLDSALELAYESSVQEPTFAELMDKVDLLITRIEKQFPVIK